MCYVERVLLKEELELRLQMSIAGDVEASTLKKGHLWASLMSTRGVGARSIARCFGDGREERRGELIEVDDQVVSVCAGGGDHRRVFAVGDCDGPHPSSARGLQPGEAVFEDEALVGRDVEFMCSA